MGIKSNNIINLTTSLQLINTCPKLQIPSIDLCYHYQGLTCDNTIPINQIRNTIFIVKVHERIGEIDKEADCLEV